MATPSIPSPLFRRAVLLSYLAFGYFAVNYGLKCVELKAIEAREQLAKRPCTEVCKPLPNFVVPELAYTGLVEYGLTNLVLAIPLPKGPVPGQQKPPCDPDVELEVEAVGACWVILGKKPPCGRTYELNNPRRGTLCVAPKKAAVRPNEAFQREP